MLIKQEKFNDCARGILYAVKPSRKHPRIVEDEAIALVEQVNNITEMQMFCLPCSAVKVHKP